MAPLRAPAERVALPPRPRRPHFHIAPFPRAPSAKYEEAEERVPPADRLNAEADGAYSLRLIPQMEVLMLNRSVAHGFQMEGGGGGSCRRVSFGAPWGLVLERRAHTSAMCTWHSDASVRAPHASVLPLYPKSRLLPPIHNANTHSRPACDGA